MVMEGICFCGFLNGSSLVGQRDHPPTRPLILCFQGPSSAGPPLAYRTRDDPRTCRIQQRSFPDCTTHHIQNGGMKWKLGSTLVGTLIRDFRQSRRIRWFGSR